MRSKRWAWRAEAVSQENVELVRAVIEAFNGEDMVRTLALIGSDFEGEVSPAFSAEPDTYRGHDGVLRYFESFHDAMSEIHFHAERLWDAGESVVVDLRLTAKGRSTEIPVEQRVAQLWSVRGGKARAARTYESLSEALAAAGLSG
jgi:ketosteroid isomerase-like protein